MLQKIMKHPTVAHLMRANTRFGNRLGNQFAGAVTYFSVLAMVPVIMFAFALTGMTLTVLRPDMLDMVKSMITDQLQGAPAETRDKLLGVVDDALRNWAAIGIVGLISLAYSGGGWIANLKTAVRSQWRVEFETEEAKSNIVVETLKNMGTLILLLLAVLATFGISQLATSFTPTIISLLHLDQVPGISLITRLLAIVVSLLAGWLMFLFIYWIFPEEKPVTRALVIGSLIGSVGLVVLQYLTGILTGSFMKNPAAALFGPVIVLMLFFNLFARLILFIAAWIATWNQPAIARRWTASDAPLEHAVGVETVPGHWEAAREDRHEQEVAAADSKLHRTETLNKVKEAMPGLEPNPEAEQEATAEAVQVRLDATAAETGDQRRTRPAHPEQRYFTEELPPVSAGEARRRARTNLITGYLAGLGTGSGLGALIAALLGRRNR